MISCATSSDTTINTIKMTKKEIAIYPLFAERLGKGKDVLIFIHGYGVSRKTWYDMIPYMEDSFDIHLVDLMGFGDSPAPVNWSYTIQAQAEAVLRYLINNNLNNIYVVGHSYGGGVSILLSHLLKVQQQKISINKLVLISPAAYHQKLPFFIKVPSTPLLNRIVVSLLPAEYQIRYVLEHIFYNKQLVTKERISRFEKR